MADEELPNGWIAADEYERIQARVPIACVDILPLEETTRAVGLIRRSTHEDRQGWCLVGGAVLRGESLKTAIERHVRSCLGDRLSCRLCSEQPLHVAEYFPDAAAGELHDPRKHAIALTYVATCAGEASARGEALEFRWFEREELEKVEFGFGQGAVVAKLLDAIDD